MRALPLLAAAALALAAGACAAPSAETSASDGAASPGAEKSRAEKARAGQPWWKLSQYSREAAFRPWVHGDVRPGRGLLSNGEDGFVLYRKGKGDSSDPTKPTKVRR